MTTRKLWLGVIALASLLVGCTPAPAPTPPDTRETDAQAIRATEAKWMQAFASKDADKVAAFYTEDASLLLPDSPVINGRSAIAAAFKPMLGDKNFSLAFASTRVQVAKSSDLAYSEGTFTMTVTAPKSKKVLTEKGKYVTVFQKQSDGSWLAVSDILNEDAPPAPAK